MFSVSTRTDPDSSSLRAEEVYRSHITICMGFTPTDTHRQSPDPWMCIGSFYTHGLAQVASRPMDVQLKQHKQGEG